MGSTEDPALYSFATTTGNSHGDSKQTCFSTSRAAVRLTESSAALAKGVCGDVTGHIMLPGHLQYINGHDERPDVEPNGWAVPPPRSLGRTLNLMERKRRLILHL